MNKLSLTICFIFYLFFINSSTKGFELKGKIIKKSMISSVTHSSRDYLIYIPENINNDEEIPVLLFLHGNGERGNDVNTVKIHGPLKEIENGREFPFIIIAPQMLPFPDDYNHSPNLNSHLIDWTKRQSMKRETFNAKNRYETPYPPYGWDILEKDLIALINNTVKEYNGDKNRIYITGLSYGGYGTWYMLSKYPEIFAAGVPICGAGNPEDAKKIGKTPVWLFHGGRDRVILPQWSLEMADSLDAAGGNIIVTVHEDLAHNCWTRVYSGKDMYDWLLNNTKR